MKRKYPHIERHQWFDSHSYTLSLTESIHMDLTPAQYENLKASVDLINESEKALTPEEISAMLESIGRTSPTENMP